MAGERVRGSWEAKQYPRAQTRLIEAIAGYIVSSRMSPGLVSGALPLLLTTPSVVQINIGRHDGPHDLGCLPLRGVRDLGAANQDQRHQIAWATEASAQEGGRCVSSRAAALSPDGEYGDNHRRPRCHDTATKSTSGPAT